MFNNSGKKIKGFVKFVYFLNLVLALLAFVVGVIYAYSEFGGELQLMLVAVVLMAIAVVVYMLLVFVSLLCLYAFGELAQSNLEMQHTLSELQLQLSRIQQANRDQVRSVPRREEPAFPRAPEVPQEPDPIAPIVEDDYYAPQAPDRTVGYAYNYKAPAGAPVYPVSNVRSEPAPGVILCSKCGGKHDPLATHCRYCGTPLQNG